MKTMSRKEKQARREDIFYAVFDFVSNFAALGFVVGAFILLPILAPVIAEAIM